MGVVLTPLYSNFQDGVITAPEPDVLPKTASPRGRNSVLVSLGAGNAVPAKRKGVLTMNATPLTSTPAILGQMDYRRQTGGALTPYHLLYSDGGRLDKLNSDGTTSPADAGTPTPFTAGTKYPDFSVAANLCFICNGTENKKFDGTTVTPWGIVEPSAAPTTAIGAAGVPNGTYEARYTYYNTNTFHESSVSPTGTARVLVNQKLNISWVVPTDTQVTHVRLYVRNTATQANFYLAGTIAIGTGNPYALDWGADTNLIIVGPNTVENDPPPVLTVAEWHQSRMFGVGPNAPSLLFYSKIGLPEAFSTFNFEPVNTDDGQMVTALHSVNQLLVIFKRGSMWVLIGDDPASWSLRLLDHNIGCTSPRSVVTVEGKTYWWSAQGPAVWDGTEGGVKLIGIPLIAPTISGDALNNAAIDQVVAALDPNLQQLYYAVPEAGSTRNSLILPWNYRLNRWASDGWGVMDAASLATVYDSTTHPYVYLGGHKGQVFKFDNFTQRDGVLSGTASGTATSATASTLVDAAAAFLTTGGGLVERYVVAVNVDGITQQRRRITANTATALTISPDWTTTPNSTYTYIVGAIDFQWDLVEEDFALPFSKKRLEFFYLLAKSTDTGVQVKVDLFRNRQTEPVKTLTVTLGGMGIAVYDTAIYDVDVYGGSSQTTSARKRVGKTCQTIRARLRNIQDNKTVTLLKMGWRAESQTDKLG